MTGAWHDYVERWYQLDEAAQSLCATYWEKRLELSPAPDWIILASPGASNHTDREFVTAEVPSPAKFVHTLPNVRGAALLQLMQWSGPVLCIQKDPETLETALREAQALSRSESARVWVASTRCEKGVWSSEFYVADGSEITKK